MCLYAQVSMEARGFPCPGTGATDGCDPPDIGAEN